MNPRGRPGAGADTLTPCTASEHLTKRTARGHLAVHGLKLLHSHGSNGCPQLAHVQLELVGLACERDLATCHVAGFVSVLQLLKPAACA